MTWYADDPEAFLSYSTDAVPEMSTVRLYAETVFHIIESHPEFGHELPSMIEQIGTTIVKPHKVIKSRNRSGESFVFSRADSGPTGTGIFVPVKVVATGSGLVKTAYFSDEYIGEVVYSLEED